MNLVRKISNMSLKNKILTGTLIAASALSIYGVVNICTADNISKSEYKKQTAIVTEENKKFIFDPSEDEDIPAQYTHEHIIVYNPDSKLFNEHKGGINETYLNIKRSRLYDLSRTPDYLKRLQNIEDLENSILFRPLKESEGILSQYETDITAIDNMKIIEMVDNTPRDRLLCSPKYFLLKELLNDLNKIYYTDNITGFEKIERMYGRISESIKPGADTPDSVGIVDLVNGKSGNCNDVSPSYFALFNYYHIKCYLRYGETIDTVERKKGLHAWITVPVNISGKCDYVDLDPTWDKRFIPLDERNNKIETVSFKKEYMRYKLE